ncbi:prepilin peptidase [Microbacterium sp. NPDC055357]
MSAVNLTLSVVFVLFAALSVSLSVIDIRTHRLPNIIVLPAYPITIGLLALACLLGADGRLLIGALLAMAGMFAFYLVLRLISPRGMGGGDVKLAGVVGLVLGWVGWDAVAVGSLAGFILGGVFGTAMLALRRADRRTRIPFGPFMLAGAWVGILAGPALSAGLVSTGA